MHFGILFFIGCTLTVPYCDQGNPRKYPAKFFCVPLKKFLLYYSWILAPGNLGVHPKIRSNLTLNFTLAVYMCMYHRMQLIFCFAASSLADPVKCLLSYFSLILHVIVSSDVVFHFIPLWRVWIWIFEFSS